jgi:hypothetical protein
MNDGMVHQDRPGKRKEVYADVWCKSPRCERFGYEWLVLVNYGSDVFTCVKCGWPMTIDQREDLHGVVPQPRQLDDRWSAPC